MFIGIAHTHAGGIILFNPTTKGTFIRHSFKYLSDIEPNSTSYVVADITPVVEEVLIGTLSNRTNTKLFITVQPGMNNPEAPEDYSYVHLPKARAPTRIHFAYQHIGNSFLETNTSTKYRLHDIVKLSNRNCAHAVFPIFDTTLCPRRFSSFSIPRRTINARL